MYRYGPVVPHHVHVVAWLILILLVALLVLGIVALVRLSSSPRGRSGGFRPEPPPAPMDPALVELRVRYARGEMSWEECAGRAANLGYPTVPWMAPAGPPPETVAAPPPR